MYLSDIFISWFVFASSVQATQFCEVISTFQISEPASIHYEPNLESLYVTSNQGHFIQVLNITGNDSAPYNPQHHIGKECQPKCNNTGSCLYKPVDTACSKDGRFLFVSEWTKYSVRKIDLQTQVISEYAGICDNNTVFNQPQGLFYSDDGLLYVADKEFNGIKIIHPNGTTVKFAGNGTAGYQDGLLSTALFDKVLDLVIDRQKNIFVTDSKNNRIRKINGSGFVSTFPNDTIISDGIRDSPNPSFKEPFGIALDALDNDCIYITEYGSPLIRKITQDGIVTTLCQMTGDNPQPRHFSVNSKKRLIYISDFRNGKYMIIKIPGPRNTNGWYLASTTTISLFESSGTSTMVKIVITFSVILFVSGLCIIALVYFFVTKRQARSTNGLNWQMINSHNMINNNNTIHWGSVKNLEMTNTVTLTLTTNTMQRVLAVPGFLDLQKDIDFKVDDETTVLGTGGTASIVMGTLLSRELIEGNKGERKVAIKSFPKCIGLPDKSSDAVSFNYEVALISALSSTKCDHVTQFFGYCEKEHFIIMKYYEISLANVITDLGWTIDLPLAIKICNEICMGLEGMHEKANIVHLDLKPGNVLIEVRNDNTFKCVLCDFGYSAHVGGTRQVVTGFELPKIVGTTFTYTAPEGFIKFGLKVRNCTEMDKALDIYAFGITCYEILVRGPAWSKLNQQPQAIQENVMAGKRPPLEDIPLDKADPILTSLIQECWAHDYKTRPNITKVLWSLSSISNPAQNSLKLYYETLNLF